MNETNTDGKKSKQTGFPSPDISNPILKWYCEKSRCQRTKPQRCRGCRLVKPGDAFSMKKQGTKGE